MQQKWNLLTAPDKSLIQPWSSRLESGMPHHTPYLSLYEAGNKQLCFLAAKHESGADSPTLKTVCHAFAEIAIIEGIQNDGSLSPRFFMSDSDVEDSSPFITTSKGAYTAYLARKQNIDFVSGEPNDQKILQAYLTHGLSNKEFLCLQTVICLHSAAQSLELRPDNLEDKTEKLAGRFSQRYGLPLVTGADHRAKQAPVYEKLFGYSPKILTPFSHT